LRQQSVKRVQVNELSTDEKRQQVREFVEDTPDNPGRFRIILRKRVDGFSPVLLGCTE